MEGHTGVWLLAALLVAALISAEAQNTPSYFEVGGELVLKPKQVSGLITSIVWKFNSSFIVGEWADGTQELEFSPRFKGRSNVNTTTGELKISKMTADDIGLYKVEINNNVQDVGFNAIAIKQVPKPVVIITYESCEDDLKSLFLSCKGDIKGAEPVTFYWEKGDGKWEKGEQNRTITIEDKRNIEKFSCRMMNPLGQKDSEPVDNPCYDPDPTPGEIVGYTALGFGVLALIAAVVWCYLKNKKKNSTDVTKTTSPPLDNGSKAEERRLNETNLGSSDSP